MLDNLKNILQEFMESLYTYYESQIYEKFNAEMRRMILKYRWTEVALRQMQHTLAANADLLHAEQQAKASQHSHRI